MMNWAISIIDSEKTSGQVDGQRRLLDSIVLVLNVRAKETK